MLREQLKGAMARTSVGDRLLIQPLLDPQQVGPGSIDLRLGTQFLEIRRRAEAGIDPLAAPSAPYVAAAGEESIYVPLGENFVLHPGQFVLGATFEFIRLPADITGQVLSRSSWGRLGLLVATAVVVQPGFAGILTLELVNTGNVPIRLYPGLRVAQLQLWQSDVPTALPYSGGTDKYKAPLGPESNRLAWETSELDHIRKIGDRLMGRV